MFVKSNMNSDVKYRKSTGTILIKAKTVTFVDDNLVTAKELKDCYGDRIYIMSQELVDAYVGDLANTGNKEVDDYLNGETEKVTEGSKEITEEEALRLQKEAEEQEAAKRAEEERLAKEAEAKKAEELAKQKVNVKKAPAKSKGKTSSKKK